MSADTRTTHVGAMGGCNLYVAADGVEVSLIGCWDHVEAHCHGPVEHFRPADGGCVHMDDLLAAQKPGRDVRVLPFGGRSS